MTGRYGRQGAAGARVRSAAGMTLFEVMVGVVIIGILAIAGGALVSASKIDRDTRKCELAAIEAANGRMEEVVHGWTYAQAVALIGATNVGSVALNGVSGYAMTTTVTQAGAGVDQCLKVAVSVSYRKGNVVLITYRSR